MKLLFAKNDIEAKVLQQIMGEGWLVGSPDLPLDVMTVGHDYEAVVLLPGWTAAVYEPQRLFEALRSRMPAGEMPLNLDTVGFGPSLPRVHADFMNTTSEGHVRLNTTGTIEDLSRKGIILWPGDVLVLTDGELECPATVEDAGAEERFVARLHGRPVPVKKENEARDPEFVRPAAGRLFSTAPPKPTRRAALQAAREAADRVRFQTDPDSNHGWMLPAVAVAGDLRELEGYTRFLRQTVEDEIKDIDREAVHV